MLNSERIANHPENVGFYGSNRENYIQSLIATEAANLNRKPGLWETLTDEQKRETVEVNGKTYVKAIAEARGLI